MKLLLFQAAEGAINWTQFGVAGGVIFVVFIFLVFVLKIVPGLAGIWKEVRLAEITVREKETMARSKEAESRTEQANGFSQLAGALGQLGGVIRDVVIDQRHSVEKVMILQRVNADSSEQVMSMMNDFTEEISLLKDAVEGKKKNGTQAKESTAS